MSARASKTGGSTLGAPTFEFVFAYVKGRRRVGDIGGEVVDHVKQSIIGRIVQEEDVE